MKLVLIFSTVAAILATSSSAAPTKYDAPGGGWESIDWTKIDYPEGTGESLPYYPSVEGNEPKDKDGCSTTPFVFTSTYKVVAKGSEVRNGTTPAQGPDDATGFFNFGINSHEDTICWNITLLNVVGAYQSPARTATHIHEAARGASGPPRLVFPNAEGDDSRRVSVGCMTGPFTTGLNGIDGKDTGIGFMVKRIEEDPAAFYADTHTALYSLGVVRGQLA